MASTLIHLITLTFIFLTSSSHAQFETYSCKNVLTSEGVVNLQAGQTACAPLEEGETIDDLGKQFLVCSNGIVSTMSCGGLRYNTESQICTWRTGASCVLPGDIENIEEMISQRTTVPRASKQTTLRLRQPQTASRPSNPAPTTTASQQQRPSSSINQKAALVNVDGDCVNVETSEGLATIKNGGFACAGPRDLGDKPEGSVYIQCVSGTAIASQCPGVLRWSTKNNFCVWPRDATCQLGQIEQVPTKRPTERPTERPTRRPTRRPTERPTTEEYPYRPTYPETDAPQTTTERPPLTRRPTQKPEENTGTCNSDNCQLPNCFCRGATPSGISKQDTPMFLMLSFDDAVTSELYGGYLKELLVDNVYGLKNPDGCPPKAAFYLSHNYTIYDKVETLYKAGHEIASHTINHFQPPGEGFPYSTLVREIDGLRDLVAQGTGNSAIAKSIVGFRAPFLRMPGPELYDMLQDYGFTYDTSILNTRTWTHQDPYWPYTLDFNDGSECINPPCPQGPYKGFWEVPMNGWIGDNGYPCAMVDACIVGTDLFSATESDWARFYRRNYENYFKETRVPMPIFLHGAMFFRTPNAYKSLVEFLQETLAGSDHVWMATPSSVIRWMQNPLTNSEMISQRWSCN